uniref:Putative secreted protein n=1 Tax=Xenopsylla cheopis TaxID=163159 RepID=A0A6M2DZG5_XENCH
MFLNLYHCVRSVLALQVCYSLHKFLSFYRVLPGQMISLSNQRCYSTCQVSWDSGHVIFPRVSHDGRWLCKCPTLSSWSYVWQGCS